MGLTKIQFGLKQKQYEVGDHICSRFSLLLLLRKFSSNRRLYLSPYEDLFISSSLPSLLCPSFSCRELFSSAATLSKRKEKYLPPQNCRPPLSSLRWALPRRLIVLFFYFSDRSFPSPFPKIILLSDIKSLIKTNQL